MEKYILQAPNCWHQFSGRMIGLEVPRRTITLQNREGQVLEAVGGEEERVTGSKI